AIQVHDLRVGRGKREVLHGLTFDVPQSALVGLLGPSGSGKTTLMRALVGVQKNVSGQVRVLGDAAGSTANRARIGYVTQAPSVYLDLTVRQNLTYFASMLGAPHSDVARVTRETGLDDQADQLVG